MRLATMTIVTLILLGQAVASARTCENSLNENSNQLSSMRGFSASMSFEATFGSVPCHRLRPGDSAIVNWSAFASPTRVAHAYRLTRTGEKSFTSEIRLGFVPFPGETVSGSRMEEFRKRLQQCLATSAPFLSGPNGQSLRIEMSTDPNVPETRIQLTERRIREDAETYSLSTPCPTLIHEILHLHGLCDEYREETIGITVDPRTGAFNYISGGGASMAFDCRHIGPESSVMNNPWAAVTDSRDWTSWEYEVCIGERSPSAESETCGVGGRTEKRTTFMPPGESFQSPRPTSGERVLPSPARQVGVRQRTRTSILEPAHFSAITAPGCREENQLYYRCSVNAYVSSTQPSFGNGLNMGGMGLGIPIQRNANSACQDTPPECRNPQGWLGGR